MLTEVTMARNGNYSCANCGLGVSRTHRRVGCVLTCNECGYESFEPVRDTLVRLEEMITALKARIERDRYPGWWRGD